MARTAGHDQSGKPPCRREAPVLPSCYRGGVGYEWLSGALDVLRDIRPDEVAQVLGARRRWPVPGYADGIKLLSIWGRTVGGRPLIVILHHAGGLDWEIVGASVMTAEQQARFREWEATQ